MAVDLLSLILLVLVVCLAFWLLKHIEMDPGVRNVIYIVMLVVVVVWLFQGFGVLHRPVVLR
jgi:hypothetical protein